jgi:hypothetical protein
MPPGDRTSSFAERQGRRKRLAGSPRDQGSVAPTVTPAAPAAIVGIGAVSARARSVVRCSHHRAASDSVYGPGMPHADRARSRVGPPMFAAVESAVAVG